MPWSSNPSDGDIPLKKTLGKHHNDTRERKWDRDQTSRGNRDLSTKPLTDGIDTPSGAQTITMNYPNAHAKLPYLRY
jgi:hypothetical protein